MNVALEEVAGDNDLFESAVMVSAIQLAANTEPKSTPYGGCENISEVHQLRLKLLWHVLLGGGCLGMWDMCEVFRREFLVCDVMVWKRLLLKISILLLGKRLLLIAKGAKKDGCDGRAQNTFYKGQ